MRSATVLLITAAVVASDRSTWFPELPSAVAAPECGEGIPANDSLLRALREGGLVIVLRHAITDRSRPDATPLSRTDRATQRNLSDAGIEQAKQLGQAVRALRVSVDTVYASPLFRTMDTALQAFGRAEPSEVLWRDGTAEARLRLLSDPPAAGTNRVLVTHNFVLVAMFSGLRPSDVREGDMVIVRPLGGGRFDVLGRFAFEEWRRVGN